MTRAGAAPGGLAGKALAGFFAGYLAGERGASPQTSDSYRHAIKLLLTWYRDTQRIPPERLLLADIDRQRVLGFLDWLETERGNSPATRNQRLAVIKSFARHAAVEHPEYLERATGIIAIKQKKTPTPDMGHLTGDEVKTMIAEPGAATRLALRDTTMLSVMYDTGARVQELCDINVSDIRGTKPATVELRGKGGKTRRVPLMAPTADLARSYLEHRKPHPGVGPDQDPLFHGPNHTRLTRWGVIKTLSRHVASVRQREPGWAPGLRVTPHTIRRSRATHLLQAGVNLIYIRDLLGHADVSTTEIYARADTETKRQAIENAYQSLTPDPLPDWTADTNLIEWLDQVSR